MLQISIIIIKMIGRIVKAATIAGLIVSKKSNLWMSQHPQDAFQPIQEDILHLNNSIPITQKLDNTQKDAAEIKQNSQKEELSSTQTQSKVQEAISNTQITSQSSDNPAQIKPQQIINELENQPVSPSQLENIKVQVQNVIELNQMQAVVSHSCPQHIVHYLSQLNFKINRESTQSTQPASVRIKNFKGHQKKFEVQKITSDKDHMKLISNFVSPPTQLQTIQEAKQILSVLDRNNFLVITYIPFQKQYDQEYAKIIKSKFDTFNQSRKADLSKLQNRFHEYAYNSASNRVNFVIIRSKIAAEYLKLDPWQLGVPTILNKTSRDSGNQSNSKLDGIQFYMNNFAKKLDLLSSPQALSKFTHFYINRIENQIQAQNKIREVRMSGDQRKILLVYSNEHRPQFHKQVDQILQKVARVEKEKVIVVKTNNQLVVRNIFGVQPDYFATIRLIDLSSNQKPLFSNNQQDNFFRRKKYQGPFQYQNLCEFVSNNSWEQYYESKRKVSSIKSVSPKQLNNLENTLLLLQKDGCQGCQYVQQSMEELKKVIYGLSNGYPKKREIIYRYGIEQPLTLVPLQIRKYSIFNESPHFSPPSITPRLWLLKNGKYLDLKVQESLGRMKQIKNEKEAQRVHELVLSDIIDRIRRSQNQRFQVL